MRRGKRRSGDRRHRSGHELVIGASGLHGGRQTAGDEGRATRGGRQTAGDMGRERRGMLHPSDMRVQCDPPTPPDRVPGGRPAPVFGPRIPHVRPWVGATAMAGNGPCQVPSDPFERPFKQGQPVAINANDSTLLSWTAYWSRRMPHSADQRTSCQPTSLPPWREIFLGHGVPHSDSRGRARASLLPERDRGHMNGRT